ncbi:MAG TPA: BMC domain-containing protein [Elusimicrobiota bacterium]|nr:BMC domain-containing protein [Elusimicrobiota bacterium]
MHNAIGLVELSSMVKGYEVTDIMLKTSNVELLMARTICPGKYIVLVAGDVADVQASVEAGKDLSGESLVDQMVIPNVHPGVFPAITGSVVADKLEALGLIETFSVASLIEAADAAAKTSDVKILEIRLAMAMGGKAYVSLTGTVAAVQAAVNAGSESVIQKGLLVQRVVIPQPRPELLREMI